MRTQAIAAKQDADIIASMASSHLKVSFHEASGTGVPYTGKINGALVSGNMTCAGTATNIWTNRGFITPQNTPANNIVNVLTHIFDELFRLDNLASGGLLLLTRFYFVTFTEPQGNLFTYYSPNGAQFNFRIHASGTNVQMKAAINDGVTDFEPTAQVGAKATYASTVMTVGAYFDVKNKLIYCFFNGNFGTANNISFAAAVALPGVTAANRGLVWFAGANAGPVFFNYWGTTAADDGRISDFLAIRNPVGFTSAQLSNLAALYHANPLQFPSVLEGL